MAQNITASFVSSGGGPEFMRSPRGRELVKLQGSSSGANDTSQTYTCQNIQKPAFCEGGSQFLSSINGNQIVFTSIVAIGSNAVHVWVAEAI